MFKTLLAPNLLSRGFLAFTAQKGSIPDIGVNFEDFIKKILQHDRPVFDSRSSNVYLVSQMEENRPCV
ncbi:hypothetical protein AYI69_g2033 [Smittium culicis]|uniref:Uncharacterized protein n=1 Tax=Smittium culicis TaxID=133412 RepID=A0A1R1YNT5_9FUNG|nr:hypothetical protein AYI69_g2033 [Smittium culicis]